MCYLKIPKDCLVRQYKETAFGYGGTFRPNTEHNVFRLPGAELAGYTFTVTELFGRFDAVQALGGWYTVNVSSPDLPITVRRTENREDGKRYKQYKFTPEEINGMYGNSFKHAVALVTIYANNGTRTAKDIICTQYAVGMVDGCWFVCSDFMERRRIDTKGVKILGYIFQSDVQPVKDTIKQHREREHKVHRQIGAVQKQSRELKEIDQIVQKMDMPELKAIYGITSDAEKALSEKYTELSRELDMLDTEFMSSLGAFYIDKAA